MFLASAEKAGEEKDAEKWGFPLSLYKWKAKKEGTVMEDKIHVSIY